MMNKKLKKSFVFSLIIVLLLSYSVHSQNLDIFKRVIGAPKISNFPLITGDMLIHDNFIFIADNAAGLIYKYSLPNLEFIDKFSALPDLLRKEEVNAIDLAKYQFYFGAVNPFDLKLRSAAKNSIYIKDLKNPTKIRELTLDGKLINILNENIEFRANNIPSSISKQISQKFYNDVTNFAEKLFYDGANLYIYNHQFDKIKIYPNLNDAIEMTPAELFNKYPELLALKLYFERDDFYIGFDNNAYTIKNNEISKYPATTSLVFSSDVNNEPNKFIGIDKNGNYYFWSALELDWYDFAADDININVIKVFDKNLKLIKLLKNDLWSKLSERYNYSRKYIDDEGNIYFVFYNTIEKYRFDGTYISTVLTQENNIAPGAVYITSQYIFVADKNNGGIAVLNNTDNQNYFMIPVTDNKFTVISHDIHKDKIVAAMTNFSATRKYKISVIAQVDEGKYRFDDIHFPQNYIDNIRISKNGRLVAFVEYEEKNMKRLRITDIHGMNKYLLYSTTAKISNIEWINDNNLVFLEDNCRIVLVDAVNNKSRRIFENRGDNISLIYPVSENEIYICADTELVNLSKIQRQSSQQSAAADTGYSINLLFDNLAQKLDIKFKLDDTANIIKSAELSKFSAIVYKLNFSPNVVITPIKYFSEPLAEMFVVKNKLYYSVNIDNYVIWYEYTAANDATRKIYSGPFKSREYRIFSSFSCFLMQYADRSVIYKLQETPYSENSSIITGNLKLDKDFDRSKLANAFITTTHSDKISQISANGNFSLVNPLPGYQKIFIISDNIVLNANVNRFIDMATSLQLPNLPIKEKRAKNYQTAVYYEKVNDINGALSIMSRIMNSEDYKDTEIAARINRRILPLLYKSKRYGDLIKYSNFVNLNKLNSYYKIILSNAYLEQKDYNNALAILDMIQSTDDIYSDFIEYHKLFIMQRVNSKNYRQALRNAINKTKNANRILYLLLYRDLMGSINLFEN